MWRKFIRFGLLTLLAHAANPAAACSSDSTKFAPSNFELVAMSDAVGIYTAVAGSPADEYPLGSVTFRLKDAMDGSPPAEFRIDWAQLTEPRRSADEYHVSDNPFEFATYGPGCPPGGFDRGRDYLLILRQSEGGWENVYQGGSRAFEPYERADLPWARTVRRYLALKALAPAEQDAALARFRDGAPDTDGRALTVLERADAGGHLRTPSQWKPTSWLVDRYEQAARGEAVDIILDGPITWRFGRDARAILLNSLVNGDHPNAMPLVERLLAAPELPPRDRGLALRFMARHGGYGRAYDWIEHRLEADVRRLDARQTVALLEDVANLQAGAWTTEEEPWRSDPHARATWPALAARLEALQRSKMAADDIILLHANDAADDP